MLLYLRLAWRNIWRHRRRTLIIVLAMGLSMAMMILYDGLLAGFNEAIYGNAIRMPWSKRRSCWQPTPMQWSAFLAPRKAPSTSWTQSR